jgi:NadR type nicotinamide-nucleotide adenylyltransferase
LLCHCLGHAEALYHRRRRTSAITLNQFQSFEVQRLKINPNGLTCRDMKKVVIIGPESTGKSTLCGDLAAHYQTLWCPEYAREYLLKHGMNYTHEDLLTIAKGQLELEDDYILQMQNKKDGKSVLFVDTNMYVMKVWDEFVFGNCHQFILDQILERNYDLYLLCNTDLAWTYDILREYPDLESRERLYHIYKDIMINQTVPWEEIRGNNEQRTLQAISAVDDFLKK